MPNNLVDASVMTSAHRRVRQRVSASEPTGFGTDVDVCLSLAKVTFTA